MSFIGIFVFIFAIIKIQNALQCDQTMCSNICQSAFHMNGTCKGNECDCSDGEKCSVMVEKTCEYVCDKLKLKGECDENGYCICKAELEFCAPWDCEEQCLEDPRAKECELAGGVVTPIACMKYAWIKTCGCLCTRPAGNNRSYSVDKNPFNHFLSVKAKETQEYYQYSLNNV